MTGFCAFVFTSATGARSRFTPTARRSAAIAAATCSVSSTSSTAPRAAFPGYELPVRASSRVTSPPSSSIPTRTSSRSERNAAVSSRSWSGLSTFHPKRTTPPRPRSSQRANPVGRPRALEPREDAGRREPLERPRSSGAPPGSDPGSDAPHPLTEPAVRPNAIFRCTSRKKTITGIAVSVDAAISAPQSVFRLVPEK